MKSGNHHIEFILEPSIHLSFQIFINARPLTTLHSRAKDRPALAFLELRVQEEDEIQGFTSKERAMGWLRERPRPGAG